MSRIRAAMDEVVLAALKLQTVRLYNDAHPHANSDDELFDAEELLDTVIGLYVVERNRP